MLTKVVEPDGRVWQLEYDGKERLGAVSNPAGERYEYTWDLGGRLVAEKTFDGREIRYGIDAASRLARVEYPDGGWRAFSYDRRGSLVAEQSPNARLIYRRDVMGRLLEARVEEADWQMSTLFERDPLGQVLVEAQGDRRVRFEYDHRGHRVRRVMPDGATTKYLYDGAGAIAAIEHNGVTLEVARDVVGREERRSIASGAATVTSGYDVMDRLAEQRVSSRVSETLLAQRRWRYDHMGRVTRLEDTRWGDTEYKYDSIGLLIESRRGRILERFSYDPGESLKAILRQLPGRAQEGPWESGPGGLLKRSPGIDYRYDARARRIAKIERPPVGEPRITEYRWDDRDQIREVKLPDGTRVRYDYDALGRRVRKRVEEPGGKAREVELVWDDQVVAAEVDSERGVRTFVHEPQTYLPALQQQAGAIAMCVRDHNGVVRELVDSAGRLRWAGVHDAFGRVVEETRPAGELPAMSSPWGLLGHYHDEETGLAYTRYRFFDPEVGRWLSPDPLGLPGGHALFGFNGSPTVTVDPDGLIPLDDTGHGVYALGKPGGLRARRQAVLRRHHQRLRPPRGRTPRDRPSAAGRPHGAARAESHLRAGARLRAGVHGALRHQACRSARRVPRQRQQFLRSRPHRRAGQDVRAPLQGQDGRAAPVHQG